MQEIKQEIKQEIHETFTNFSKPRQNTPHPRQNFLTEKKRLELRQEKLQESREHELVDIVVEATCCSSKLAYIVLKENNMYLSDAIRQLERDLDY